MITHTMAQYSDLWWRVRRGVPTASEFSNILTDKIWNLQSVEQLDEMGRRVIVDGLGHRVYVKARGRENEPRQTPDAKLGYSVARKIETMAEYRERITGDLGQGAYTYACSLIGDIHSDHYGEYEEYESDAMKAGKLGESNARKTYAMLADVDFEQVGFCTTDDGRFGCSPDSMIGTQGLLEIKCPTAKTQVSYLLNGTLPDEYRAQVQGQIWVTGRDWCDFFSYHPGLPPLTIRVHRNEETERLGIVMEAFWTMFAGLRDKIQAMQPRDERVIQADDFDEQIIFTAKGN